MIALCLAALDPNSLGVLRCEESFMDLARYPDKVSVFIDAGPGPGCAVPQERAVQAARKTCDPDLYVVGSDDVECVTRGWDEILHSYRRVHPGARVLFGDEGRKSGELVCHPVFTGEWVGTLGYGTPPGYVHYYSDTAVERTARLAGALHYIPGYRIRHWVKPLEDAKMALMPAAEATYRQQCALQEEAARRIRGFNQSLRK